MDALKDLEVYVDDAVQHFVSKMKTRVGQDINMGLFVQLFAFGESAPNSSGAQEATAGLHTQMSSVRSLFQRGSALWMLVQIMAFLPRSKESFAQRPGKQSFRPIQFSIFVLIS